MPREDGNGVIEREAWISGRRIDEVPEDGRAEWALSIDGTGKYFLNDWRTDSLAAYDAQCR